MTNGSRVVQLAILVALAPAGASAQTFYLPAASLGADDAGVGEVKELRVSALGWRAAQLAELRFEDARLSLTATVDLSAESTYVAAGVGAPVELAGTDPWRLTMLAGGWAPVLAGATRGVRIALPPALPVHEGWIPAGAPPTHGESELPWKRGPFDGEACPGLTVFATADGGSPFRVPEEASIHLEQGGAVRVELEGFALHAFAKLPLQCPPQDGRGLGLGGIGVGCGDGFTEGRVVQLPAGTTLFATPNSTEPFATLRQATAGLEVLHSKRTRACGSKTDCSWSPPLPSGAAEWLVPFERGPDPHFILRGWVRVPAEQLKDDPAGSRGFGLCSSPPKSWPRLPALAP